MQISSINFKAKFLQTKLKTHRKWTLDFKFCKESWRSEFNELCWGKTNLSNINMKQTKGIDGHLRKEKRKTKLQPAVYKFKQIEKLENIVPVHAIAYSNMSTPEPNLLSQVSNFDWTPIFI